MEANDAQQPHQKSPGNPLQTKDGAQSHPDEHQLEHNNEKQFQDVPFSQLVSAVEDLKSEASKYRSEVNQTCARQKTESRNQRLLTGLMITVICAQAFFGCLQWYQMRNTVEATERPWIHMTFPAAVKLEYPLLIPVGFNNVGKSPGFKLRTSNCINQNPDDLLRFGCRAGVSSPPVEAIIGPGRTRPSTITFDKPEDWIRHVVSDGGPVYLRVEVAYCDQFGRGYSVADCYGWASDGRQLGVCPGGSAWKQVDDQGCDEYKQKPPWKTLGFVK